MRKSKSTMLWGSLLIPNTTLGLFTNRWASSCQNASKLFVVAAFGSDVSPMIYWQDLRNNEFKSQVLLTYASRVWLSRRIAEIDIACRRGNKEDVAKCLLVSHVIVWIDDCVCAFRFRDIVDRICVFSKILIINISSWDNKFYMDDNTVSSNFLPRPKESGHIRSMRNVTRKKLIFSWSTKMSTVLWKNY